MTDRVSHRLLTMIVIVVVLVAGCGSDDATTGDSARAETPMPTTMATPIPTITPEVATETPTPAGTPTATETAPGSPVAGIATPDDMGIYRNVSIEAARQIVPFPLAFPDEAPAALDGPDILLEESPPLATGGRIYRVTAFYEVAGDETPEQSIQYLQASTPPQYRPRGETTTVVLGEKQVNKVTEQRTDAAQLAEYWWETDEGVFRGVLAVLEGEITEDLVERLVAAIVASEASAAAAMECASAVTWNRSTLASDVPVPSPMVAGVSRTSGRSVVIVSPA